MTDVRIEAPATITITHAGGSDVITITVPASPITPPVEPAGKQQYSMALAGTGDWIIRVDNVRLDIDTPGTIYYGGKAIPGSEHSYAVGYDPGTNATYRQPTATAQWVYWGGSMTDTGDWHTPAPPWTPPAKPPIVAGDIRTRMIAWLNAQAGKSLIVGQYCDEATAGVADANALKAATGKEAGIIGTGLWPAWPNTYDANAALVNPTAIDLWKRGGLPMLNSFYPCPKGPQDMYKPCDPSEVLRAGSAQYAQLHKYYDQEIASFKAMRNAGVGCIIHRFFLECRWGFWWGFGGGSGWTDAQFKQLWAQHDDYYAAAGLGDFCIRVYSQGFNTGDGSQPPRDTWPGDARTDFQGEDIYNNDQTAYKGWYDNELKQHPKHGWAAWEWGSGNPNAGDPSVDMRAVLARFKTQMPATIMMAAWCGSWRLANNTHIAEFMADPYVRHLANLGRPS